MPKSSKRDGAMSKTPKTGVRVYAGGTPAFDENKGRYVAPPRGSERLSPGVYRTPGGELMTGRGRVLPRQEQRVGQRLAESMAPGQSVLENIRDAWRQTPAYQPVTRPPAPNQFTPIMPNYNPANPGIAYPGMAVPQQRPLSLGQVSRMSGPELQAMVAARRQPQQQTNMRSWLQMQLPWLNYADAQRRG